MSIRSSIDEYCDNLPDGVHDVWTVDGFDEAILGYDKQNNRVVYSEERIIEILMSEDGMTEEDALDHFYYNIKGPYLGEGTPLIIKNFELD